MEAAPAEHTAESQRQRLHECLGDIATIGAGTVLSATGLEALATVTNGSLPVPAAVGMGFAANVGVHVGTYLRRRRHN